MPNQTPRMRDKPAMLKRPARRFLRNSEGNITIEYMIWIPFMFLVLMLILDVSMTLHKSARMWDVARDAARSVALGGDKVTAVAAIKSSLSNSGSYIVTIDNTTDVEKVVVTIDAVGSYDDFKSILDTVHQVDLFTRYTMRNEV